MRTEDHQAELEHPSHCQYLQRMMDWDTKGKVNHSEHLNQSTDLGAMTTGSQAFAHYAQPFLVEQRSQLNKLTLLIHWIHLFLGESSSTLICPLDPGCSRITRHGIVFLRLEQQELFVHSARDLFNGQRNRFR